MFPMLLSSLIGQTEIFRTISKALNKLWEIISSNKCGDWNRRPICTMLYAVKHAFRVCCTPRTHVGSSEPPDQTH